MPDTPHPARAGLLQHRAALRARLAAVESDLSRDTDPLSPDFAEQAVQRENDQVLDSLRLGIRSELEAIERALARIDAGLYGQCIDCGQAIEPQRLALLPETVRCARCAGRGPGA